MELLDRYLQAVGNHLPQKKRDDILRELRANILEGVEEREAELGRRLTIEEEEATLKGVGNPIVVGMRYWPKQYLIGPSTFPYYVYALKTVIPLAMIIATVVNLLDLSTKTFVLQSLLAAMERLPGVIFMTAVWITIVFVAIEFGQMYVPGVPKAPFNFDEWKPRNLPRVRAADDFNMLKAVFEVSVMGIGLIWMSVIPFFPFLMLGPAASQMKYFRLAPELLTYYWAFLAAAAVQWFMEVFCIAIPRIRSARPYVGMAGRAATAVIAALLLRIPNFVWLSDLGRDAGRSETLVRDINNGLHIGLKVMVVITIVQLLWDAAKLAMKKSSSGLASGSTQTAL